MEGKAYKRPLCGQLLQRLAEPRRFIQVISGARQTGKTTAVLQAIGDFGGRAQYATADEPALKDRAWIEQQWEMGRLLAADREPAAVLALDEVHKISDWAETVKRLWDEDSRRGTRLHVVLLGSAPLLMQRGLGESLAGRFEVLRATHWSLAEMRAAFDWTLDEYVYYGGYPGSAPLRCEPERWRRYIRDSLIETTLARDILLLRRVDKPALLCRLFDLSCRYSGQVLSYTKMLGQLQDAGNTTTLAHYLELLQAAGLVTGLEKHTGQRVRQRASSPKLQVYSTALITAQGTASFDQLRCDRSAWGRLVESAVGAHLANQAPGTDMTVGYWATGNREVDFVLSRGSRTVAIEVKSGRQRDRLPGLAAFATQFPVHRQLLVGDDGIPLETFLLSGLDKWLE
jgi:predicted AAA+ superfamily ATPase